MINFIEKVFLLIFFSSLISSCAYQFSEKEEDILLEFAIRLEKPYDHTEQKHMKTLQEK